MNIRSLVSGFDKNIVIFSAICLFLFPLLPEYVAPLLTVILAATVLICYVRNKQHLFIDNYAKLQLAFVTYTFLSATFSRNPLYTLRVASFLLLMFLGQLAITMIASTKIRLQIFLHALLLSGVIVAGLGSLQSVTFFLKSKNMIHFAVQNPFYIHLDKVVFKFLNRVGIPIKMNFFLGRANGTFSNPNIYVAFLLITLPIAVYYLLDAKTQKRRIIYSFCSVVLCFGIAASQSRNALASVVFSTAFLIYGNRHHMRKLLIVFSGFVGILASIMSRLVRTVHKLKPFSGNIFGTPFKIYLNPSTHTHFSLYLASIEYITSDVFVFLFGIGYGVQNSWEVFKEQYNINQPHAHNLILELWLEMGLVGITLFLLAAVALLYDLRKILKVSEESRYVAIVIMASFVGFFSFCIFDFVLFSPKIIQCYFILCGLASATVRVYSKKESKPSKKAAAPNFL